MWNVNKQNLLIFLIFFSLFHGIRAKGNVKEHNKIATGPQPKNNFGETLGETVITTAFTVDDEKFDDNELKKLFVRNFKYYEKFTTERYKKTAKITRKRRKPIKPRNVNDHHIRKTRELNETYPMPKNYLECVSCYGNRFEPEEERCYAGTSSKKHKCSDAAQCYTELHPQYIKRGCILPDRVNRTFICKCPFCNDKPANDYTYYSYKDLTEWEFDNYRLEQPLIHVDLLCRVCETRGRNLTIDHMCRVGSEVEYAVCGRNQFCYTNINDEAHYVSRGCIDLPAYNSIFFFCNSSSCNTEKFDTPKVRKRHGQSIIQRFLISKMKPSVLKLKSNGTNFVIATSFCSWLNYKNYQIVTFSPLLTLFNVVFTRTIKIG